MQLSSRLHIKFMLLSSNQRLVLLTVLMAMTSTAVDDDSWQIDSIDDTRPLQFQPAQGEDAAALSVEAPGWRVKP